MVRLSPKSSSILVLFSNFREVKPERTVLFVKVNSLLWSIRSLKTFSLYAL